jgi:ribosome recycling factor
MLEDLKKTSETRMNEAVDAFSRELSKIRAGRASPALLEGIRVESYGVMTPLKQLANIVNEDNRTLVVNVWDKSNVGAIDKAIRTADLGLNPATAGLSLRIVFPPLTEESRAQYTKQARAEAETARVAVRNVRRDVLQKAKQLEKDGHLSEDKVHAADAAIQKITDAAIAKINALVEAKEQELKHI